MSTAGIAFFIVCAIAAVGSAVCTVMMKSPLRAAVGLLAHIISLAGLYLTLHAEMLAAVQLIVYAGAVVVLFVFVIMLVGPTAMAGPSRRALMARTMAAGLLGVLFFGLAFSWSEISIGRPTICRSAEGGKRDCTSFGGVEGLGQELFGDAALPFELVSILLLVAILGALAVARGRSHVFGSRNARASAPRVGDR